MSQDLKRKRKEVADQYAKTFRPMGVYQLRNQVNGKVFVASSMNLDGAYNKETFVLRLGTHMNKELQKDWTQYGEEQFVFEVLEVIKPEEEWIAENSILDKYKKKTADLEKKWLSQLEPYDEKGYNRRPRAT